MKKYKYHITKPKDVDTILKEGLKCGVDGYIYLCDFVDIHDKAGRRYLVSYSIAVN